MLTFFSLTLFSVDVFFFDISEGNRNLSRLDRDETRPVSLEVFGIETVWALSRPKIFETGGDAPVSSRSRRDGSTNCVDVRPRVTSLEEYQWENSS